MMSTGRGVNLRQEEVMDAHPTDRGILSITVSYKVPDPSKKHPSMDIAKSVYESLSQSLEDKVEISYFRITVLGDTIHETYSFP